MVEIRIVSVVGTTVVTVRVLADMITVRRVVQTIVSVPAAGGVASNGKVVVMTTGSSGKYFITLKLIIGSNSIRIPKDEVTLTLEELLDPETELLLEVELDEIKELELEGWLIDDDAVEITFETLRLLDEVEGVTTASLTGALTLVEIAEETRLEDVLEVVALEEELESRLDEGKA